MDLSWTGPGWVPAPPRYQVASTWGGSAVATIVGLGGTALTAYLAWRLMSRLSARRRGNIAEARRADRASEPMASSVARALSDDVICESDAVVSSRVLRVPSVADT